MEEPVLDNGSVLNEGPCNEEASPEFIQEKSQPSSISESNENDIVNGESVLKDEAVSSNKDVDSISDSLAQNDLSTSENISPNNSTEPIENESSSDKTISDSTQADLNENLGSTESTVNENFVGKNDNIDNESTLSEEPTSVESEGKNDLNQDKNFVDNEIISNDKGKDVEEINSIIKEENNEIVEKEISDINVQCSDSTAKENIENGLSQQVENQSFNDSIQRENLVKEENNENVEKEISDINVQRSDSTAKENIENGLSQQVENQSFTDNIQRGNLVKEENNENVETEISNKNVEGSDFIVKENMESRLSQQDKDQSFSNNIQSGNLEPVSPGNEGLSPEREEDYQDDEDEDGEVKEEEEELGPRYSPRAPVLTIQPLKSMLEDIEDGELDYDEEGQLGDGIDDLPDLPEYDPGIKKENISEDGEIVSDNDDEREDGEIRDEDETGQVYICVDSKFDRWKKATRAEQKKLQELEEGQIEEDEPIPEPEVNKGQSRFIPRTLCKYFNNGLCRWGSTCRFLHPGVNDKGIPKDTQPTWNAIAGNYAMLRPPGLYPNAYGKAPPAMECVNGPVIPTTAKVENEMTGMHGGLIDGSPKKESAWEKGLRKAKEIKEAARKRRQEDVDFEEKRMNMRIPEYFPPEREPEQFDAAPIDNGPKQNTPQHYEHDVRGVDGDRSFNNDYNQYDRRGGRQPQAENKTYNKNDRIHINNKVEKDVDRSSGRARLAELPSSHPVRREERQRQREREKRREHGDRSGSRDRRDLRDENKPPSVNKGEQQQDPRRQSYPPAPPPVAPQLPNKSTNATEWHDPWMRTQTGPVAGLKPESKSGLEAVSDSSSSDSDSDSDSDSSSSGKSSSSDSDSSSSTDEQKQRKNKADQPAPRRDNKHRIQSEIVKPAAKDEPLSYNEWKRQQSLQKSQQPQHPQQPQQPHQPQQQHQHQSQNHQHLIQQPHHRSQQHGNNYKAPGGRSESRDRYNRDVSRSSSSSTTAKRPSDAPHDHHRHHNQQHSSNNNNRVHDPRANSSSLTSISNNNRRNNDSTYNRSGGDTVSKSSIVPKNDDKFDSPKRKKDSDSDSSDSSDSDSDSDSDSSDSDSDDSDSDSDGDNKKAASFKADKSAPVKLPGAAKPVLSLPAASVVPPVAGTKRPARKDDLLKELKAVEDAIARKRAKID